MGALQHARPNYSEVGESYDLVHKGHLPGVLGLVEVKEVVGVLSGWVFGVPDGEEDVEDCPEDEDDGEVEYGLVDGPRKHYVLVVLLVHQRRLLVKVVWNYCLLDALPSRPRQPL